MKTRQTDFKIYLRQSADEIKKELLFLSKQMDKEIKTKTPDLMQLNNRFTESFFGGKMLRGTLVKLGYELVETTPSDAILKPAAAFEILHSSILIHDDIIDQSPKRRGRPAMHIHKNSQYGISQAICLGDIGISLSIKLIVDSNFPIEKKSHALSFFLQIINDTIFGEMLDVESTQTKKRTEKQITTIHRMKTALYSFVGPLSLGAILNGASDEDLKYIKLFGEPLGIAFQIQDDILGIFGDEEKIGKNTTSDIEENKSTLLLIYALKHASKQQQEILNTYYGKKGITKAQQAKIKKVFIETGARDDSQRRITNLISEAKRVIPQITENETKQQLLTQLADFLIDRKK